MSEAVDGVSAAPAPSARKEELLAATRAYVARTSLSELSLRPLAAAIGSSPRVLLFLFGSKEGLVRAVLAAGREEQLALLARSVAERRSPREGLDQLWRWLVAPERRSTLRLFYEGYVRAGDRSPDGPWRDFDRASLEEWLPPLTELLAGSAADPTLTLAVLRGLLLDLLADDSGQGGEGEGATGHTARVERAWQAYLATV